MGLSMMDMNMNEEKRGWMIAWICISDACRVRTWMGSRRNRNSKHRTKREA